MNRLTATKRCISLVLICILQFTVTENELLAESIYSGPINRTLSQTPIALDIDFDGIEDVSLSWVYNITFDFPSSSGSGYCTLTTLNKTFALVEDYQPYPMKFLSPKIDWRQHQWRNGHLNLGSYSNNLLEGKSSGWKDAFSDLDVAYIHLAVQSNGMYRIAWVQMLYPDDYFFGQGPIVMGWGYETDPTEFDINRFQSPSLSSIRVSSGQIRIRWNDLVIGAQYAVERSSSGFSPDDWKEIEFNLQFDRFADVQDPLGGSLSPRFYRIRLID